MLSPGKPGSGSTEAEAASGSDLMRHAVEKFFRKEQEKATQTFQPLSKVYFEQEIGLKAHIQREMPLFLTYATTTAPHWSPLCCRREDKTTAPSDRLSSEWQMPTHMSSTPTRSAHWASISASRSSGRAVIPYRRD